METAILASPVRSGAKSRRMTNSRVRRPLNLASTVPPFAEAPAWKGVGDGWRPLFGSFRELGVSFEWHDFQSQERLDWARSFHPGGVEVCLNLAGHGEVRRGATATDVKALSHLFYQQGDPPLSAWRSGGERHRFITVEYSPEYLRTRFAAQAESLHPAIRDVVRGVGAGSFISATQSLTSALVAVVNSLRHPPVFAPAQPVWFESKATELAALLFFRPPDGELFCTRTQRAGRERVERAQALLRRHLAEPPSLDELGRQVGCSPFYLSRLFSQETGMTVPQFLRQIRMERAAELLRSGRCNVTEAALEVGYNSLSHFSSAFHETFGCCPGLYPLRTPTQRPPPLDLNIPN